MSFKPYPFTILAADGKVIDRAANIESAVSVLYGDLSRHDGLPRTILCPADSVGRLEYHTDINADCFGIPLDIVKVDGQYERDRLVQDLNEFARRVEEDRKEPDKLLCHVQSMRRAAQKLQQEEA